MRSCRTSRLIMAISSILAAAALMLPIAAATATTKPPTKPKVVTGGAQHVLASSALLTGVVDPAGFPTSYYFQYGPTTSYGLQTPTVSAGSGMAKVKVGQSVVGLHKGELYYYRIVGTYSKGSILGRPRTFVVGGSALKFELAKVAQVVVGTNFLVTGTLRGLDGPDHTVILQASPYPFLEAFSDVGLPVLTNSLGGFAFHVSHLSTTTQFRVITSDPRPLYSHTITVPATVRVTLHVRASGRRGLVRLYGTVTPAAVGAKVEFQLLKAARPRKNEETETSARYFTQYETVVKKDTRSFSRFSLVVTVRHGGSYRAFVQVRPGPVASGYSTQTVSLHAAPNGGKSKHKT